MEVKHDVLALNKTTEISSLLSLIFISKLFGLDINFTFKLKLIC